MRPPVFVLSALVFSAVVATAQTGFSTKTYPAALSATSDNNQLLSADFNGDGRADLFSYGSRSATSTVSGNVFLNNGSGGFGAPVPLPGTGMLNAAAIGDMNGDGFPDIVGCQNSTTIDSFSVNVIVYLNQRNGTFKALPAVSAPGECNALTLGDAMQNGHLDVITVGYTPGQYGPGGQYYPGITTSLDVFANPGSGTLTESEQEGGNLDDSAAGSAYTSCGTVGVAGGDFLNNGSFDLIVTTSCQPSGSTASNYAGTTYYFPYSSTNGYGPNSTLLQAAPEVYTNGQAVHLSSNGDLDAIFLGRKSATSGSLIYILNNGSQNFTFNNLYSSTYFEGAAVADFTGNGINDVATTYDPNVTGAAPAGPPMLTILNQSSAGAFTDQQNFATGTATNLGGGLITADFNGDGAPDMATLVYDTGSKTTALNVYTNTQTTSACSAPSTTNTNLICTPSKGETVNSPVSVTAASNVSGFTLNRLYLDNVSVYQVASQDLSTSITAATGTHTLVLVSYDNSGKAFSYSTTFTVGSATGSNCIPSSAGVDICSPVSGSTDSAPVTVTAGAMAQAGTLTAMRVYIDNVSQYTINAPAGTKTFQFSQSLPVGDGTHHLVVVGYESTGGTVTNSLNFTVPIGTCKAPTGGTSLAICNPTGTGTLTSPFTVSAGAYTSQGYIASMRIYIDSVSVALLDNTSKSQAFSINQSLQVASGKHTLVVVAYPSGGGSVSSQESITVQ